MAARSRWKLRPRWPHLFAIVLVAAAMLPASGWWAEEPPKTNSVLALRVSKITLPDQAELAAHLGPFRLESILMLESDHSSFGGFSALLPPDEIAGTLTAFSDKGFRLTLPLANDKAAAATLEPAYSARLRGEFFDIEAATIDPHTRTIWLGTEGTAAIARLRPGTNTGAGTVHLFQHPAMSAWEGNAGAEAVVRLSDGRFIVLREAYDDFFDRTLHEALLFPGDPLEHRTPSRFRFAGSPGYRPTDMAQLPDGRVLILERKLIWPMPTRFAGRIAIADPDSIEPGKVWRSNPVAYLSSSLPVDNFEGIAVLPERGGRVAVWVISDDNGMRAQRTLLWRLSVNPADLTP